MGMDFSKQTYISKAGNEEVVTLWDTAGQEKYRSLTEGFFNKADGVLVVFSITDTNSFE